MTHDVISLDTAMDRVLDRLGKEPADIEWPCNNGHYDCTYRNGGPCLNEKLAEEFAFAERMFEEHAADDPRHTGDNRVDGCPTCED